jgi:hypothetical protein
LKYRGLIDDERNILMWIFLPNLKKGKFKNTRKYFEDDVLSGQELNFPIELQNVTLFDYRSDSKLFTVEVIEYPERINNNKYRKIDSVLVQVQN